MAIKEIHVVSNTHWDREFRFSFQKTRMMLVKMMDELLNLLEKDKNYASYTLDSHTIIIEDYLQIRPQNKERIKKLVKEKRIFIGPWYTLPDIPNIGPESVVRNLIFGHKIGKEFGHTMKAGYTPCSWGQISQLPQIYSEFGIDSAFFYRGISPHETSSEFIWESPDGSQIIGHRFALFARYNYYYLVFRKITYGLDFNDRAWEWGKDGETPFKISDNPESAVSGVELLEPEIRYIKENLEPAINEMMEIEGPHYAGEIFLAMHGHDISVPHPLETKVMKDSQDIFKNIKIIHSDLEKYIRSVKKNIDLKKLPVLKGERRSNLKNGLWTYLLPATLSARTTLKILDSKTEDLLTKAAEPLSILTSIVCKEKYPSEFLELAWKYILSNHTHDANAGCAPDFVINDVIYRLRQSSEISKGLIEESVKIIAKNIKTNKLSDKDICLLLVNPLPVYYTDAFDIIIDLPSEVKAQSFNIVNSDGSKLENIIIKVEDSGCFVDNKWNVPQTYLAKRYYLKVFAEKISPLGYETFKIEPQEIFNRYSETLIKSPNIMENEYLEASINSNGTINIKDKENGKVYESLGYLMDQGEVGNAWRHQAPSMDKIINSLSQTADISIVEDTPYSATFRADIKICIPEDCPDETSRSDKNVQLSVSQFITLKKGLRRVDFKTQINNNAKDHWLRIVFPANIITETSLADSHFDVLERKICLPDCKDWREPAVGTYPVHSFVSLKDDNYGLSVLVEGLKEFEILRNRIPSIAISLLRCIRIKLEVAENRKQEIPDSGSQCPGISEFRTSVYIHSRNWKTADSINEASKFKMHLYSAQFGKNKKGILPQKNSLLSLSENKAIITALKKSEKNKNLIIRLYNPTEKKITEKLKFNSGIIKSWVTNLSEERKSEIRPLSKYILKIDIQRKKILTLEIQFN